MKRKRSDLTFPFQIVFNLAALKSIKRPRKWLDFGLIFASIVWQKCWFIFHVKFESESLTQDGEELNSVIKVQCKLDFPRRS